jgi:hypothetical protein
MKKLPFLILLILSISVSAQTKQIEGFLGIKFGSTKEQTIAAMKLRGAILKTSTNDPDILEFKNVKLGHRDAVIFDVRFVKNKAFQADFYFLAPLESQTIEYYDGLVSDISDVYGPGKSFKNFKSPYQDGDGFEMTAIKLGKAEYSTFWIIGDNSIAEKILPAMGIKLTYQDTALTQLAIDEQKDKEKADY